MQGLHHLCVFIRVPKGDVGSVLAILSKHKVKSQQVTALPFTDGEANQVLIIFSCSKPAQEAIHKAFQEEGLTLESGWDENVIPLALAKDYRKREEIEEALQAAAKPHSDMSVFQSTIKARIAVENMLALVHEGASFSFDFFMLVLVASTLAAIGLLTNSSVTLVASMLVSPMMGPILGFTFGTVVRDFALVKTGLKSEAAGLLICLVVGYIGGLIAAPAAMRQTPWPTSEMTSRGDPSSLYIGAAIAIPSGVGVALSIMGQNTNSLVGVAISASLLPPIVNAGILFAEATLQDHYFSTSCLSNGNNASVWDDCCEDRIPTSSCPHNVDFRNFCCTSTFYTTKEYETMGGISFALTVVNICCIWVFASLTFHLKEVAPLPNKSELWTTLVPKARKYNAAVKRGDIKEGALLEEIAEQRSKQQGRLHMGGHKLTRDLPVIGRGGLQAREMGAANGMVFPTHNGGVRGRSGELFANLRSLYMTGQDESGQMEAV